MMCYKFKYSVGIHQKKKTQNRQWSGIKQKQEVALSAKRMKLYGVVEYYLDVDVQF